MHNLHFVAPRFFHLAALLAVSGAAGCGGTNDDLKKQMKALETQVTALRADADRLEERLEAMELNTAVAARAARDDRQKDAENVERPRLKVIRLAPDEEAPAKSEPESPAPEPQPAETDRPVIRGTGDKVIKSGAYVQGRRDRRAGKSMEVLEKRESSAVILPRLSPPFPTMTALRRVSSER
jgi:outer membrane murein-binding lipoprotein Lpp